VYQFREYEASAIDYETHVENNLEALMKYRVRRVYYDPSNPQGAAEMKKWLKKNGLEIAFLAAINDVDKGISEVSRMINAGEYCLMDTCLQTKDEARNYVWRNGKPLKELDDLMDAVRYGLMGRKQYRAQLEKARINPEPLMTKAAERIAHIFEKHEADGIWMRRL
jgi:hypothetical protein